MAVALLKFGVVGAMLGVVATVIGDAAAEIVAFGSAAILIGVGWRKVVRPLIDLADLLGGMPEWMKEVNTRLDRGHGHFQHLEERLDGLEATTTEAAGKAQAAAGVGAAVARDLGVAVREQERPLPAGVPEDRRGYA